MNRYVSAGACAAALLLAACGGGGGSAPASNIEKEYRPPQPEPTPPPAPAPASVHVEYIAGSPTEPAHYANGTLATARFYMYTVGVQLASDKDGNLFVADDNAVIRKITPDGQVTLFAGAGMDASGAADPAASFTKIGGMVADANGNLYVSDQAAILKISPAGVASVLAGTQNQPGFQDGAGAQAKFSILAGAMAVDRTGNLYVADGANNAIRRIAPDGSVQTLALSTPLAFPQALAIDTNGNLVVSQYAKLLVFDAGGQLIRTIGNGAALDAMTDGPASQARVHGVSSIAYGPDGLLYMADADPWSQSIAIRTMDAAGNVRTLHAGSVLAGLADGPIASARFGSSYLGANGLAFDRSGNLFLADINNHGVRKITPDLQVSTYTGGFPRPANFADGTGPQAAFRDIAGFGTDKAGNYYVADSGNCALRKITPKHVVSTIAGVAGECSDVDGTGSSARFRRMYAMTQDAAGNLYVAEDTTVRKVTPEGVVTTLAGKPGTTVKVDGQGAAAAFVHLRGIAMGPDGNLLVSDGRQYMGYDVFGPYDLTLRTVTPQGVVSTGPSIAQSTGDLRFDAAGNLYLISGGAIARRPAGGTASSLLDSQGQAIAMQVAMKLAPDDAGNLFYVGSGTVYRLGTDGVVKRLLAVNAPGVPADVLSELPYQSISALMYIGNHKFLASFDNQVVVLTLQ